MNYIIAFVLWLNVYALYQAGRSTLALKSSAASSMFSSSIYHVFNSILLSMLKKASLKHNAATTVF